MEVAVARTRGKELGVGGKKKRKDNVGVLLRRLDKTHHGKPVSLPATNISMPPTISHTLFLGVELATDQLRAVLLDDQLDILGVENVDFDAELPEYQSVSHIFLPHLALHLAYS